MSVRTGEKTAERCRELGAPEQPFWALGGLCCSWVQETPLWPQNKIPLTWQSKLDHLISPLALRCTHAWPAVLLCTWGQARSVGSARVPGGPSALLPLCGISEACSQRSLLSSSCLHVQCLDNTLDRLPSFPCLSLTDSPYTPGSPRQRGTLKPPSLPPPPGRACLTVPT